MILKTLNNREIDSVIFDLDGTLVDSMWMWRDIDIEYLAGFGLPFDPRLQSEIAGMSMNETAVYFKNKYGISDSTEKICSDWVEMSFEKYKSEVPLKPYASELLDFLRSRGVKTAIASSNAMEMIEVCLKSNAVYDKFDAIVSSNDAKRGKPFPDVFLLAAERIGADPAGTLVFEDIPEGIKAARAAGMSVIAVFDRHAGETDGLKKELADLYIADFGEFLRAETV